MDTYVYDRPGSCTPGKEYYLKVPSGSGSYRYQKVEFLDYRPHPAEVLIRDGLKARMIYRADLYQRRGSNGRSGGKVADGMGQ